MNRPITQLPTVDEILGGKTQGGVPRPAFSFASHDDEQAASHAVPVGRLKAALRRFKGWLA